MVQIGKYLPYKHGDLSLITRIHITKRDTVVHVYNPSSGESETGGSLGPPPPSQIDGFQPNERPCQKRKKKKPRCMTSEE